MFTQIVKKPILCISIIAMLLSFIPVNAFAQSSYDEQLLQNGCPQFILEKMSLEQKKEYKDKTFLSGTVLMQFDGTDETTSFSIEPYQNDIPQTYAVIKDTTLALIMTSWKNDDNTLKVNFMYYWYKLPYNRYKDPIGISYDSEQLELIPSSFEFNDYFHDKYSNEYLFHYSYEYTGSTYGLVYYADIPGATAKPTPKLIFGTSSFDMMPKENSGETTFHFMYAHKKNLSSLTMSIPSYNEFKVSGSGYDYMKGDFVLRW